TPATTRLRKLTENLRSSITRIATLEINNRRAISKRCPRLIRFYPIHRSAPNMTSSGMRPLVMAARLLADLISLQASKMFSAISLVSFLAVRAVAVGTPEEKTFVSTSLCLLRKPSLGLKRRLRYPGKVRAKPVTATAQSPEPPLRLVRPVEAGAK